MILPISSLEIEAMNNDVSVLNRLDWLYFTTSYGSVYFKYWHMAAPARCVKAEAANQMNARVWFKIDFEDYYMYIMEYRSMNV